MKREYDPIEPLVRYQDLDRMKHELHHYTVEVLIDLCSDICSFQEGGQSVAEEVCNAFNAAGFDGDISPMSDADVVFVYEAKERIAELEGQSERLKEEVARLQELCRKLTPAVKPKQTRKRK